MIVPNIIPFHGQHCETTATGSLLKHIGVEFSEPMLFGLGEGLGYIFWNMKTMDYPFLGGRIKPDELTENICKSLELVLTIRETASSKKAWENVTSQLAMGKPVGLKLDCYHLDYFSSKIHFAAHYVAIYGYDDRQAFLIDTEQQGGKVATSLQNLELARKEKGPMSSNNRSYTITKGDTSIDLENAIISAAYRNACTYLNPPIANIGYKGIQKTSKELVKWFTTGKNIRRDFQTTALLMEKAGTGGALFRKMYMDFLKESYDVTLVKTFNTAHLAFVEIADYWTKVSSLFDKIGATEDIKYVNEASDLLSILSKKEQEAMQLLKVGLEGFC